MRCLGVASVMAAGAAMCWLQASATPATGPAATVPCGTPLSAVHAAAGQTVALHRGCTYSGSLTVAANNVTVTASGVGRAPVIRLAKNGAAVDVYGSHDTIENLSLKGVATASWNCGGQRTPAGHTDGVILEAGATRDTVSNVTATGFYAAVYIMAGSSRNVITSNTFIRNLELNINKPGDSAGAFGVLLWGDRNVVEHNTIDDNQACSLAYGHDGSAVEVYGGSYNLVRWNKAANDNAFTELGSYPGHIAAGNSFDHNTVTGGTDGRAAAFLVTRGSGDPDGPVYRTSAADNNVTLTGAGDLGAVSYAWRPGDGTLLTLTGNYLDLGNNQVLYEDGGYVDGGGNTFIGTCRPSRECPHRRSMS